MLQISLIRENKELVLAGLNKKNFKQAEEHIEQILQLDQKRRETQKELDGILSETNNLAKEIGNLMKSDKKDEAEKLKITNAHKPYRVGI